MKLIPTSLTRAVGRHKLSFNEHSPNIYFGLGLACVFGGTVLACRATLKLSPALDKFKEQVDDVKGDPEDPNELKTDGKDLAYVYAANTYDLLKLYAPAIIIGGTGITLLTKSHNTLSQRNASLTAAYTVVSEAFNAYRDRVREEVGEEKERDIYLARRIVISSGSAEDDSPTEGYAVDIDRMSPYARFFDEYSTEYKSDPSMNKLFIQCQQNYVNQRLHARGYIFLNEVYTLLGLEETPEGQLVGWMSGEQGVDNHIDFGMFEAKNDRFLDGYEPSILLDFNVDGIIYNKIGNYQPHLYKRGK